MSTRHIITTIAAGSVLTLLAACSGSTPSTPTSGSPMQSPADSPAATAPADGNCQVATFDGSTKNTAMQELAVQVYESLQCGTSTPLPDQLKAAGADPEIKAQAKAAGATLKVDSAAGGTVMQLVAGRSGCTVTVLDSMDAKTGSCLDL